MRSFQISGLTAKWGIGANRLPPIWDNNLVGYWDARSFPDGALTSVPNKATMAGKAPDLTVTGATMAGGTLQFDGVDDGAEITAFLFPDRFTILWDIDWLGTVGKRAGIIHAHDIYLYNNVEGNGLQVHLKSTDSSATIPNTSVGVSTNGRVYAPDGTATQFGAAVGNELPSNRHLYIGADISNTVFTEMGFRQLLIFNKELSQAELDEVLRTMFPA